MKIYTRTGDKGYTSLMGGTRVLKSDPRVDTYAAVDELNSTIGLALAFLPASKFQHIKKELKKIQSELFDIGSYLSDPHPLIAPPIANRSLDFEKLIDKLTTDLPPLKNFILPGGSRTGAQLHICRTHARRAERKIVALSQKESIDNSIIIYLNRLSDLFFTLTRYVNNKEKIKETKWTKK